MEVKYRIVNGQGKFQFFLKKLIQILEKKMFLNYILEDIYKQCKNIKEKSSRNFDDICQEIFITKQN